MYSLICFVPSLDNSSNCVVSKVELFSVKMRILNGLQPKIYKLCVNSSSDQLSYLPYRLTRHHSVGRLPLFIQILHKFYMFYIFNKHKFALPFSKGECKLENLDFFVGNQGKIRANFWSKVAHFVVPCCPLATDLEILLF